MNSIRAVMVAALMILSACSKTPQAVLGTLERDRISLPSTVFERIADVRVHEGEQVQAGATLMTLESARASSRLQALAAEVARLQGVLDEAAQGPRQETIAEARARSRKAQSLALVARQEYARVAAIVARKLLPAAELDRARAARDAADADVAATHSALQALLNGTRREQITQAESALAAATAQAASAQVDLERTEIRAPRAGLIDSLPYKMGDQPPLGATLAVLLVGAKPYARVYVPQPMRAQWQIGTPIQILVAGEQQPRTGKVRAVRSEPSFTPYFALAGEDAARLSYLAEIELDQDDATLAVGLPVSATRIGTAEH